MRSMHTGQTAHPRIKQEEEEEETEEEERENKAKNKKHRKRVFFLQLILFTDSMPLVSHFMRNCIILREEEE